MQHFNNIFAVTIWYNPGTSELDALKLYNTDVTRVILVDNTPTSNAHLLENVDNIEYIPLLENKGIAEALNIGCTRAMALGAEWILTMDQDSRWDRHSLTDFLTEASQYDNLEKVGIITPYHDCDGTPERHHRRGRFEHRKVVMCSGNLLSVKAWHAAEGFRNDFFIDSVDDEICCHLWRLGYEVVRANNIFLNHHLGEAVVDVPLIHHNYIPHKPWRYYYIARNIRRMMALYPEMRGYYRHYLRQYLKRLLLYDWHDKISKLSNFRRGWHDGK